MSSPSNRFQRNKGGLTPIKSKQKRRSLRGSKSGKKDKKTTPKSQGETYKKTNERKNLTSRYNAMHSKSMEYLLQVEPHLLGSVYVAYLISHPPV